MLHISKKVISEWKANNASIDEKANYLVDNFSSKEVARSFLELFEASAKGKEKKTNVISITQSQFDSHFAIKKEKEKKEKK